MKTISNSRKILRSLYISMVSIILVSCLLPTPARRIEVTRTPTKISPGYTSTESESTLTPSLNKTLSLLETSTLASTKIPTPIGDIAISKVENLLKTNANCNFPCWWGIIPGKTPWDDASSYIKPFASFLSPRGELFNPSNLLLYTARFQYSNSPNDLIYAYFYNDIGSVRTIQIIDVLIREDISFFLEKMGIPNQIWIYIQTLDSGSAPLTFKLILFYNSGVMLSYDGEYMIDNNHFVTVCPTDIQNATSELWLWNSDKYRTFNEIGEIAGLGLIPPDPPDKFFKTLGAVSDFQTQDFYNIFVNPATTECIKSPTSNWFIYK